MSEPTMRTLFEAARRSGAPLLAIRTADPEATIAFLLPVIAGLNDGGAESPIVQWDAGRGMTGVNKLGSTALAEAKITAADSYSFVRAMDAAARLAPATIVFAHHANRQLHSQEPGMTAAAMQAVANLRGPFKKNFRMLVVIGPQFTAPAELKNDFVVISHPLPNAEEIGRIIDDIHAAARKAAKATKIEMAPLVATARREAIAAVTGLSHFAVEQQAAMSIGESGYDVPALWERKNITIEETPGLSVYRGKETFTDLRGLDSVKLRLRQHVSAKTPVGVAVWIDEGADVFSNVETDTSGVKTDQQRELLVRMEQHGWRGVILVGVPGSGKSALARAFGNEAGVPTIQVDYGAMESKYVGESESRNRAALDVIEAVGNRHAFFLLTANSLRGIRPQFQARFRRGIFFFDLPTAEERDAIWRLYLDRYGIKEGPLNPRPNDTGWVGREIRECCESAWDCGVKLAEAARFIVPVSRSRATEIEAMRREAHGRFLDASEAGPYQYREEPMEQQVRAITLPPNPRTVN